MQFLSPRYKYSLQESVRYNIHNLCSSVRATDKVPRPYKTTGSFFFSFLGWGETKPTWHVGQFGLFYQPWIIDDECEAVGGMRTGRGNRSIRRKPPTAPLCSPQIPHDLGPNSGRRGGKLATMPELWHGRANNR
jgi:hypothetical protein